MISIESKNTFTGQVISFIVVSILLLSSCVSNTKFNKAQWIIRDDMGGFPDRSEMVNDLLKNNKTIGLSYPALIDLLGQPQSVNKDTIYYETYLHYDMIDPNYSEGIEFIINKDSTIIANRTTKWQKDTSVPYWVNPFVVGIVILLIGVAFILTIICFLIKYMIARFNRHE